VQIEDETGSRHCEEVNLHLQLAIVLRVLVFW